MGGVENWPDLRSLKWKIWNIHSVSIHYNTSSWKFENIWTKTVPTTPSSSLKPVPECTSDFDLTWWPDLLTKEVKICTQGVSFFRYSWKQVRGHHMSPPSVCVLNCRYTAFWQTTKKKIMRRPHRRRGGPLMKRPPASGCHPWQKSVAPPLLVSRRPRRSFSRKTLAELAANQCLSRSLLCNVTLSYS